MASGEGKRQCVTETMAAGMLWRKLARRPSPEDLNDEARNIRLEQTRIAIDAHSQMGTAEEYT